MNGSPFINNMKSLKKLNLPVYPSSEQAQLLFLRLYGYNQQQMRNIFNEQSGQAKQAQSSIDFVHQIKVQQSKKESIAQKEKLAQKDENYPNSIFDISQYLSLGYQQISDQIMDDGSIFSETRKNYISSQSQKLISRLEKKVKPRNKSKNSPYHNFQKHLNNYLKKLLMIPHFRDSDEDFQIVARAIWNLFLNAKVKTKVILHLVFSGEDQNLIQEATLKKFGFFDIYRGYDKDVVNRAKNYLSKLAIDQIDANNLKSYLKTRKIQKKQGLIEYILNFRSELDQGNLKRRIKISE